MANRGGADVVSTRVGRAVGGAIAAAGEAVTSTEARGGVRLVSCAAASGAAPASRAMAVTTLAIEALRRLTAGLRMRRMRRSSCDRLAAPRTPRANAFMGRRART